MYIEFNYALIFWANLCHLPLQLFFVCTVLTIKSLKKWKKFFLVMREVEALFANYPIMSGSSIWLFRHLEHPNPFIISDFIGKTIRFPKFVMELLINIFYWTPAFLMCFFMHINIFAIFKLIWVTVRRQKIIVKLNHI